MSPFLLSFQRVVVVVLAKRENRIQIDNEIKMLFAFDHLSSRHTCCLHCNLAELQSAERTNKRSMRLPRIIYVLYLFSMTYSVDLFIFHVQLLLHSIIVVCDGTGLEHFCFEWNELLTERHMFKSQLNFYWNCSKLFADEMWKYFWTNLQNVSVWWIHPHICLHGCEMQLAKYSSERSKVQSILNWMTSLKHKN